MLETLSTGQVDAGFEVVPSSGVKRGQVGHWRRSVRVADRGSRHGCQRRAGTSPVFLAIVIGQGARSASGIGQRWRVSPERC
jgi:hypothetical protein